jgi:ubiquinone/menaquinone biosynthesis C-methylase UbiE
MNTLFTDRSLRKELLDGENIPFVDIALNMQELDAINTKLGGHAVTIAGLEKVLSQHYTKGITIKVVEIGCGGGDNLRAIKKWAEIKKVPVQLVGVDMNEEVIQYASAHPGNEGIKFIASEYSKMIFADKPAVLFNSLFCHHFNQQQLVYMMRWMHRSCTMGFFINDLHRHPLAYYSIRAITSRFSKSYLVKNDAPLSVLRGFKRKEWEKIYSEAGLKYHSIEWKWAFRWLVTCVHE